MGVGTRLFDQFFRQMAVDAGELGASLPFVIWESHRPGPTATAADWDIWAARTKLFDRVGGQWVEGVNFYAPNFAADDETIDRAPDEVRLNFNEPVEATVGAVRVSDDAGRRVDSGDGGNIDDDDAAFHFEGTELREVVSQRDGARGYRVTPAGEEPLEPRRL